MYLFKGIQGREKALQLQPIYAANMSTDPTVYPQIGAVALTPLSGHIIGFFFFFNLSPGFLNEKWPRPKLLSSLSGPHLKCNFSRPRGLSAFWGVRLVSLFPLIECFRESAVCLGEYDNRAAVEKLLPSCLFCTVCLGH